MGAAQVTPEHVRELTEMVYCRLGPQLTTHVQCRVVACIPAGIAEAWSVPASVEFIPSYNDPDGPVTSHYRLLFENRRALDGWRGQVRLLEK
jgi:hypothetical protein